MCFEALQKKEIASFMRPTLHEQTINPENVGTNKVTGPSRLAALRYVLKTLPVTWTEDQQEFINRMTATLAKQLFRDDLPAHIDDFMDELSLDTIYQELMTVMPRRFGKTVTLSGFAVGTLFAIEGVQIGIFATGQRIAQKMLEQVYQFICLIPGMKDSIVKHNFETIWLQGPQGPSDIRKVSCYPSNVKISVVVFLLWGVR